MPPSLTNHSTALLPITRAFVLEKNTLGDVIDYRAAVAGALRLVPDDGVPIKLAADYQHMADDGLFLDDAEPFDALLRRCGAIELKANTP